MKIKAKAHLKQIAKTHISRMQALFHQVPLNEVYGDQAAEKLSQESSKSPGYIPSTLTIILRQNRRKTNKQKKNPGGSIPNQYRVERMAQLSLGYS